MRVRVLQRMGLRMVQPWLRLWVLRLGWVLELKLGFELLLVHTGRPVLELGGGSDQQMALQPAGQCP
ncbi:hypothetical protein EYF80_001687 [Liparis tanakae]|uniref:Uncharacterized protein n=1 Tax=Liparis tanakae TaxID=230148 RepID=A0A4Z2JCZ9_9TELE|nr:hypothetical protein EYF80_001687 [Liparis tanakae]